MTLFLQGCVRVACLTSILLTSLIYLWMRDLNYIAGAIIIFYFIAQSGLSIYNFRSTYAIVHAAEEDTHEHSPLIGIVMVGYREDPVYWRTCLRKIKQYAPCFMNALVIVIDGDEPEDLYMKTIVEEVLAEEDEEGFAVIPHFTVSVHLRPHQGKRHVMDFGIRRMRQHFPDNTGLIVMDSDTYLEKDSIRALTKAFFADERNGCATGNITIFNQVNVLAKVVHARYGYAFCIERGAMSTMGCMNCCSGPFSIYRQSLLDDTLLAAFTSQECCSYPVGPGDDRHLTNLIMQKGYYSRQNPIAIVSTETPTTLIRYLQQQLRWSRSFYREQYYQIEACARQNLYLSLVTSWELCLPFLVVVGFFPLLQDSLIGYIHRIGLALLINIIRTLVLVLFFKDIAYLWNILVFGLYFAFLLPIKLYACVTFPIQQWVTSSRQLLLFDCSRDMFGMLSAITLWYGVLGFSLFYLGFYKANSFFT